MSGDIKAKGSNQPPDTIALLEPKSLSGIVAAASDITMMLSRDAVVMSVLVNENSADYGNLNHWVGRSIREFLTSESIPKFDNVLKRYRDGEYPTKAVELNHSDNAIWEFPIRYTFHPLESEGSILLMGRDLRPVAETQRQLVQAQIALERGYESQREYDSRYRLLLASVTDAIILVSLSDGRVTDINDIAAGIIGSTRRDAIGSVFASHFANSRRGEIESKLVNLSMTDGSAELEAVALKSEKRVTLIPKVFRVGGDRVIICRLELRGDPAVIGQDFATKLETFYRVASDAMLFTNPKGQILTANDSFLSLVDAAHLSAIKGRSLSEFLSRGEVDLHVVLENVLRSGHLRLYSTELVSDYGSRMSIELSATVLREKGAPEVAYVIRDTGRGDGVRMPSGEPDEAAQQNMLQLIGSAPLKEIVAETSDVVEKLCIETALQLTMNNRVAAAEMLGLSRQSLYVKLRKYDLLSKGTDT